VGSPLGRHWSPGRCEAVSPWEGRRRRRVSARVRRDAVSVPELARIGLRRRVPRPCPEARPDRLAARSGPAATVGGLVGQGERNWRQTDVKIERRFTEQGRSPYAGIAFQKRTSEIRNPDGSVVFRAEDVLVPESWSQVATDILAQKYFRKAGVPQVDAEGRPLRTGDGQPVLGGERDARQVFDRLAGCWTHWGREYDYFSTEEDAQAFHDELCYMLAAQYAAPNSPQWFNTGLHHAYGIEGPPQGHWYV